MHFQASLMAAATLAGLASAIPPPVGTGAPTPVGHMNPGAQLSLKVDKEHKCQIELVDIGPKKLHGEVHATGGFGTFDPHHHKCHSNATVVEAPGHLRPSQTSGEATGSQANGVEATLSLFFKHEESHNGHAAQKKGDLSISIPGARYNVPLGLTPGYFVYNGTDWLHAKPAHHSSHPNIPVTTPFPTPRVPVPTPNAQ